MVLFSALMNAGTATSAMTPARSNPTSTPAAALADRLGSGVAALGERATWPAVSQLAMLFRAVAT